MARVPCQATFPHFCRTPAMRGEIERGHDPPFSMSSATPEMTRIGCGRAMDAVAKEGSVGHHSLS